MALAVTGVVVALTRSPDRSSTVAATGPETPLTLPTSTALPGTTTPPPTTVPAPVATTTIAGPTPTTSRPPSTTTTTTLVCRNSIDPACGEFRWDPIPPNQPLTVQASVLQVGGPTSRTFTFHVVVTDPDAEVDECRGATYGDGKSEECVRVAILCAAPFPPHYGPWTPPDPTPGRFEYDVTHTYAAAGTFQVEFPGSSTSAGCTSFYGSEASRTVTVVVP